MSDQIRIGFDLDGVIAQHSMGGFWVWLRKLKERTLKNVCPFGYYYPSTFLERWIWMVIDRMKKPFSDEENLFVKISDKKNIRFYLVTGRFKFLEKLTKNWLRKHRFVTCFHRVLMNTKGINPIVFKANVIKDLDLDFFVDDDLETINYLKEKTGARLYWIVPPHRKKSDNHDDLIKSCQNITEVLKKIVSLVDNS